MSKLLPYILVALALALLWSVAGVWISGERDSEGLLEDARASIAADDFQTAVRLLDRALESAATADQTALYNEVLLERAGLYQARRVLDSARADYLLLLDSQPDQIPLLLKLARLDLLRDDYEAILETTERVLSSASRNTAALDLRGQAYLGKADAELLALDKQLEDLLADSPTSLARSLARRVVALLPDDPMRVTLLHQLDDVLSHLEEARTAELLASLDATAQLFGQARANFVQSFDARVLPSATLGYLKILRSAGAQTDLVEFGLNANALSHDTLHAAAYPILASALFKLQRPLAAAEIMSEALDRGKIIPKAFLPDWCAILYRAERWGALGDIAIQMGDLSAGPLAEASHALASFYRGMALHRSGNHAEALPELTRFLQASTPEHQDLELEAHLARAQCHRELGSEAAERDDLKTALAKDRDCSGQAWARLAEIHSATGVRASQTEAALANAMRLTPTRSQELFPAWVAAGEAGLAEKGREVTAIVRDLLNQDRWVPSYRSPAYELYAIGKHYEQGGEDYSRGLLELSGEFLKHHPDFLPALELLGAAYRLRERWDEYASTLVRRIELEGVQDRALLRELQTLPPNVRDPELQMRLMRADPRQTGLLALAQGMRDRGETEDALFALVMAGQGSLGVGGRILTGELLVAEERWPQALEVLAPVKSPASAYQDALRLRVQAALGLRQADLVQELMTEVVSQDSYDGEELIPITDVLLRRGQWRPALTLLQQLEANPGTRDGDVLMRLGIAYMIGQDLPAAARAFDRAEAFENDGGPDIGRVLLAASQSNWSNLLAHATDLRRTNWRTSELQTVALAALEERTQEALERSRDLVAARPDDPLARLADWAVSLLAGEQQSTWPEFTEQQRAQTLSFLMGTKSQPRDPRTALALLLALDWHEWTLWAIAELRAIGPEGGALWPAFLEAEGFRRLDEHSLARRRLDKLLKDNPEFTPAWGALESIEQSLHESYDDPALLAFRAQRRKALGERPGEQAEAALARSIEERNAGNLAAATSSARKAVEFDPELLAARLHLAQLLASSDDYAAAIEAFTEFLQRVDPEDLGDGISDYAALLERAWRADELSRSVWHTELEILRISFPKSPAVPLAHAWRDLYTTGATALGLTRAYRRLDDFREESSHEPLESMQPGATRAWFQFYLRADPAQAERFVQGELERIPELMDLWLMAGEACLAQGRLSDAHARFTELLSMIPSSAAFRQQASLLATFATDREEINICLQRAALLSGDTEETPDLQHIRAIYQVNAGPSTLDAGISKLERLWTDSLAGANSLDPMTLGRDWASSLLRRGDPADATPAREQLESCSAAAESSSDAELLMALAHLAGNLE